MSDRDVLGQPHVVGLTNSEQVKNLIREAITAVETLANDSTATSLIALNSPAGTRWRHRTLLAIGLLQGQLMMAKAGNLITVQESETLLRESLGVIMRAQARVNMGSG